MGVFHFGTVNQPILNKNEKKVLNGICKYPTITDSANLNFSGFPLSLHSCVNTGWLFRENATSCPAML